MVYGTLRDYLTGEELPDTDDERFRQAIARMLVEEKGFAREEITPRCRIETLFAGRFVTSRIDFVVRVADRPVMVVRYGPGSLVTRERAAVAAARVLDPEVRIPFAVVTNGRDAEVLDTATGKVIGTGLSAVPTRAEISGRLPSIRFEPFPEDRRERELRILNAYDVEVCCAGGPCPLPGASEG
nr:type I restriction enzyme HsdR N-terminal domain-containing protein [Dissulfurirhabdus thermomarina]